MALFSLATFCELLVFQSPGWVRADHWGSMGLRTDRSRHSDSLCHWPQSWLHVRFVQRIVLCIYAFAGAHPSNETSGRGPGAGFSGSSAHRESLACSRMTNVFLCSLTCSPLSTAGHLHYNENQIKLEPGSSATFQRARKSTGQDSTSTGLALKF